MLDAVVVGSGPNGLAAAVELALGGASVTVLEGRDEIGGGTRTGGLTLPGFSHDICSGCHPMGVLSPFFRSLPLEAHGYEARESTEHTIYEMLNWFDKYVKNAPPRTKQTASETKSSK